MTNFKLTAIQELKGKLNTFIKKYYANKLLRGLILFIGSVTAIYLIFSALEYQFTFPSEVRIGLFYSFILVFIFFFIKWIGIPLYKLLTFRNVISHEKAAIIIGQHFPEIEDKILNVLQLDKQNQSGASDLVIAGINQKISNFKFIPFNLAVNFKENKKYLKYAIPPLAVLLFLIIGAPNILRDSNQRLIQNTREFRTIPFEFKLNNPEMEVIQYEDFKLNLSVIGEKLPSEVKVVTEEGTYILNPDSPEKFSYTFKKVQKDIDFHFAAAGYASENHRLTIITKPSLLNLSAEIDYPSYTGLKDQRIKNVSDLSLPEGTKITWNVRSKNTEELDYRIQNKLYSAERVEENRFDFKWIAKENIALTLLTSNQKIHHSDSITYLVNTIPDRHPQISVEQVSDSANDKFLFFMGEVNDDYGLRKIELEYIIENVMGDELKREKLALQNYKGLRKEKFTHTWDLNELGLLPGQQVKWFFRVWDNDQINGSKSTKTALAIFKMPTKDEVKKETNQDRKDIKEKLDKSLDEARELQEEIKKIKEKVLQKESMNWEDKKAIKDLMKRQQELKNELNSIDKKFDKSLKQKNEFLEYDENIKKKQEALQKLMDQVLNEELEKMFKELEKMMEKFQDQDLKEKMEDFEMSNEELEKELDRMLELFKQLEFEEKAEEIIKDLEELAEKQNQLAEDTENKEKSKEELAQEQEELDKKFEELKKDINELEDLNRNLEKPNDLGTNDRQQESISKDMKESLEQLQKNKKSKASKSQKSAGEKMQEMAQSMSRAMQSSQQEQREEDMEALRQLLENLITLSFDQEKLMDEIKIADPRGPVYVTHIKQQQKLKTDFQIIEDSLVALSKRIIEISSFVNSEISVIKQNQKRSLEELAERRTRDAAVKQQYIMTGLNNLALMLDESLKQMQQQMAEQMSGSQMCQKPGKGKPGKSGKGKKPSLKSMQQLQKQLSQQMQEMQKMMKEGKMPGKSGMSQSMAQMAAQQSAIRKALKELEEKNKKEGKGSGGNLDKIADEMEKIEEDLVNKRFSEELIKRQEDIITRLLEAEESEREREYSEKRKSETAEEINKKNPPILEEYLKQRNAQIDLYYTIPPELKPFYRKLVEQYFENLIQKDR